MDAVNEFGASLESKSGPVSAAEAFAGKKLAGIYFSAHWCPPIYLPIYLLIPIFLSIYLSTYLSIDLSTYLPEPFLTGLICSTGAPPVGSLPPCSRSSTRRARRPMRRLLK